MSKKEDKEYIKKIEKIRKTIPVDLVKVTDLDKSSTFSSMTKNEVFLKLENLQRTGSFKIRGAYNKISKLTENEKKAGVITASAGNHGQAVALAAKMLGIKSIVVVPEGTPIVKYEAIRQYNMKNGKVMESGETYDDAYSKACEICKKEKMTFVHAYDDIEVIKGQGTIGVEILQQLPDVDYIFCPIGGGGLISGIASYVKRMKKNVKIIGVQSENAPSMFNSFNKKKMNLCKVKETICDGIAVKKPGGETFKLIMKYVDQIVTVSDEEVAETMLLLMERAKTLVEGAGASSLAAVLFKKVKIENKKVIAIISGGNLTSTLINRIIIRGLIKSGRLLKFKTRIPDVKGSLIKILKIIADAKGSIMSIQHERSSLDLSFTATDVYFEIETRNHDHIKNILCDLKKKFEIEVLSF